MKYLGIELNKGWLSFNIFLDVLIFFWLMFGGKIHHQTLMGRWIILLISFSFCLAIHYGILRLIVFVYNKSRKS